MEKYLNAAFFWGSTLGWVSGGAYALIETWHKFLVFPAYLVLYLLMRFILYNRYGDE
jgi:hypothetical protein